MIVAIDGPAGSGKSTVAKAVAERLHMHYLDTGAMYRSVALLALRQGVAMDDEQTLTELAGRADVGFEHEGDSAVPTKVLLNGEDVTRAIRTQEVDAAVSAVSRVPGVRDAMVERQRAIRDERGMVAEGRDIGTVVFPDADVKIYLTASPEERARRRHRELTLRGESVPAEDVHERILARDEADSSRDASPLVRARDAVLIDTTGMTVEQVVEAVTEVAASRSKADGRGPVEALTPEDPPRRGSLP